MQTQNAIPRLAHPLPEHFCFPAQNMLGLPVEACGYDNRSPHTCIWVQVDASRGSSSGRSLSLGHLCVMVQLAAAVLVITSEAVQHLLHLRTFVNVSTDGCAARSASTQHPSLALQSGLSCHDSHASSTSAAKFAVHSQFVPTYVSAKWACQGT